MTSVRRLYFSSLISPITMGQFHQEYYERAHFVIAREDPDFYHGIFSYGDVDRCAHVARESGREVINVVPPPGSKRGRQCYRGDQVVLSQLHKAFGSGDTISMIGVEKLWPPVAELAAALSEELSAMVSVNSYLTPPSSQGFTVHFDAHDVLILQVEGEKDWYLYQPSFELPVEAHRLRYLKPWFRSLLYEQDVELVEKLRLRQGDLLYLPRGLPHKAVSTDQASLHLSVGIHPLSWLDLLGMALELVGKEKPELRRSLPLGFFADDAQAGCGLSETFHAMVGLFAREGSFEAAFDHLGKKTRSAQTFPPDGHFEQLAQISGLAACSTVRRRPGVIGTVVRGEDAVSLVFAGTEIRGPLALAPAFEYVRDHERFRVCELPGEGNERAKVDLVRRLVVEGVLRRDQE